jgi:hypothetical protein
MKNLKALVLSIMVLFSFSVIMAQEITTADPQIITQENPNNLVKMKIIKEKSFHFSLGLGFSTTGVVYDSSSFYESINKTRDITKINDNNFPLFLKANLSYKRVELYAEYNNGMTTEYVLNSEEEGGGTFDFSLKPNSFAVGLNYTLNKFKGFYIPLNVGIGMEFINFSMELNEKNTLIEKINKNRFFISGGIKTSITKNVFMNTCLIIYINNPDFDFTLLGVAESIKISRIRLNMSFNYEF